MIPQQTKHFYEFGSLRLDPAKRVLLLEGKPLALTAKVFDTLLLLVEKRGQVMEKDELMKLLWPDSFVEEANLTQNISILRKVLGESPTDHHYIVTVPGRGYRFVANVTKSGDEETQLIVEERTRTHIVVSEEERADPLIEGMGVVIGEGEEPKSLDKVDTDRVSSGRLETAGASSVTAAGAETAGLKPITTGRRRQQLGWALTVVFLFAAIVSIESYLRLARAPAQAIISEILPPEKTQFNFQAGPPVLSPDGRTVAFSAADASGKNMLWVRSFDSLAAQPLAGTEEACHPFWSPDSRALGFFADGKLKTLEVSGGPAVFVADAPNSRGGSWNRGGTILFVPNVLKGLYQVAASGGAPVPVLEPDASKYAYYVWPRFLSDGKHFLYSAWTSDPRSTGTYFASLDGKENRLLLRGAASATYVSGFLLYLRDSSLLAQAIDPERGQLEGGPHTVAEHVAWSLYSGGFFDVSENGVLIYQAGGSREQRQLIWFDRAGNELGVIGEAEVYKHVQLSPDGARLAFSAHDPNSDLWVDELTRGVRMRLTNDPETDKGFPVWSPDGSWILFAVFNGKARLGIYQKPSTRAGGEELLLPAETSDPQIWPTSLSPDRRFILYTRGSRLNPPERNLWVLPLVGDRKPRLFVQTASDGQFSSDGRWVAYTSWESRGGEIYVVPFYAPRVLNTDAGAATSPGGKWQISPSGGFCPRWRRDAKEIFYLTPNKQMMAVEVEERGSSFEAGKARPLFRVGVVDVSPQPYDVTPDGKRFVMATQKVNPNTPLTLVENWTALLRNKP